MTASSVEYAGPCADMTVVRKYRTHNFQRRCPGGGGSLRSSSAPLVACWVLQRDRTSS